jgi:GNAT superfamily N-acetyltransferase
MKINIRRALEKDCAHLLELVQELATYERAADEVSVSLETFSKCGFSEKPIWWAYVAEQDSKIVGFALWYIRYSTWKGPRMYLEDIIVTESARGQGIGALLFNALLKEADDLKLTGIAWQVLDWNEPAINFYKKYAAKLDGEWINGSLEAADVKNLLALQSK